MVLSERMHRLCPYTAALLERLIAGIPADSKGEPSPTNESAPVPIDKEKGRRATNSTAKS